MMKATIKVSLLRDRTKLGTVLAMDEDGQILAGPFPCLAISDNAAAVSAGNPRHDPLKTDGDLPTGTYRCVIIAPGLPTHSYGPGKRIMLTGIAGDALTVSKPDAVSGKPIRSGLLDHGGDLNPAYTWWQGLRPTHGCLRLKNEDMAVLVAAVEGSVEIEQVVEEVG